MAHIFVPVVDQENQPLMPTTPARARRWLSSGKATGFWKGGFFCARLNVEPSAREQQPIAVGIDPGSKREGIVVASATHTYASIQAEARTGVKEAERDSTRMRRKPRQNPRFSPLQVGKHWFYKEMGKLAHVQTKQGYETHELREQLGLKKTAKKLAEVWIAHSVDAWVLAYSAVGGRKFPDNQRLVCIAPFTWHRRQLHRFQPEKGGKRKSYGGTLSQGIKRGTLIKHPEWGKVTVGGTSAGKLSLHDPETNKRLTQSARVADCKLIKLLRWRARLVPTTANQRGAYRCWKYGHVCPSSCTKPQATATGGLRRSTAEAYSFCAVLFLPQALRLGTRRNSIQLQRYYAPILPEPGKSGKGRDVHERAELSTGSAISYNPLPIPKGSEPPQVEAL
jgi:hypothetical protein